MDPKTLLLLVYLGSGLLMASLSIPLIRGKVPPNPLYGFRVPKTLRDERVWYPANRYASQRMLVTAVVLMVAATATYFFLPGLGVAHYAIVCGCVILGGLAVSLLQSFRYLRRL